MTDEIIRKWVKPAHAGACIPDPAHRNDLPQNGLEVVWDHYWRSRELTEDVIVSDTPFDPPEGQKTGAVEEKGEGVDSPSSAAAARTSDVRPAAALAAKAADTPKFSKG